MLNKLAAVIERNWYGSAWKNFWLLPLWPIVSLIVTYKRARFLNQPPAENVRPVVVVGNLSVGGTGKTPLIVYLVERARALGLHPGIVSRGYGGKAPCYPLQVNAQTPVAHCGDEPMLLHARLNCPVVVDPQRRRAAQALADQVDIIFSDDGLQHYAMARRAEIVVVDGKRRFGNGWLLPIGPLREPLDRLATVDVVLVNGDDFTVEPTALVNAKNGNVIGLDSFNGRTLHAVAGIGNPERFYRTLQNLGIDVIEHSFADHHPFQASDFYFAGSQDVVVMTEKDWVKCRSFAQDNWWYVPVNAQPNERSQQALDALLLSIKAEKHDG